MSVHGSLIAVLAAVLTWYLVLSLAARNQDGSGIAWLSGALALAAGVTADIGI